MNLGILGLVALGLAACGGRGSGIGSIGSGNIFRGNTSQQTQDAADGALQAEPAGAHLFGL